MIAFISLPRSVYDVHKKVVEVDLNVHIGCKLCVKYCPWETMEMIDSLNAKNVAKERTVLSEKEWMQESEKASSPDNFFSNALYGV